MNLESPVGAAGVQAVGFKTVGEALRILHRGFVIDQPDEPDPGPQAPDGNPWCEACRGARVVAIRQSRLPTTYLRCPDCLHAAWATQQRVDRLLGALPPRFAEWRLETFPSTDGQQQRAIETARRWLEDASPSWLFLWGPTGHGKTGLAVGILHELALRGNSTALRNVPDLLTTIKSTFSQEGDESESTILEVLAAVDVLCLDDLGAEYHRGREDWAAEKVFQIVAARHAGLKRTIVTSNYSLEQLQDRLGHPRTLRRIVDMTGSRWIVDFRRMPQIGAV
ncbi:MAG TPA: ATP-binding protein [Candidatus Acidoferrum sp.]|nr:ATP-binding protein [Candidatus Acidoferrum sp.]